jgi:hypothetical protein
MWCSYSINSVKKHLVISCQTTWFLNCVLGKFVIDKEDPDHPASTHLLNTRGLLTRIGTQGTTPHGLGRPKEGSAMTQAHHPKDSRGPWHALQGVDNYIYRNVIRGFYAKTKYSSYA